MASQRLKNDWFHHLVRHACRKGAGIIELQRLVRQGSELKYVRAIVHHGAIAIFTVSAVDSLLLNVYAVDNYHYLKLSMTMVL